MEDISSWKEKFEICVYAKKLLDKLEYLNTKVKNPVDIEEVKKGIYYARKYHGSQMRQSGRSVLFVPDRSRDYACRVCSRRSA
ncbi:hypothetical protein RMAECT_0218 [Rickettsia rhipicephali str. Ect]|uniref:Uncharacterized protein n=2 Tax=spotted fever group TaxID=114277 RepID=A0A0F3PFQ5_RICRH|nr:guanosine polyphosphate pyrophosphohydrolase/synthetase-like protein [Rickettsia massiliae str. AZT80]KJV78746.1 hypothetical protein RMAECT_0218 [Rickettsia rhipicephali str. Ect]